MHDFAAILRVPRDESLKGVADNLEVLVDARPLQQTALQSVKNSSHTRLSKTAQNALKALHRRGLAPTIEASPVPR